MKTNGVLRKALYSFCAVLIFWPALTVITSTIVSKENPWIPAAQDGKKPGAFDTPKANTLKLWLSPENQDKYQSILTTVNLYNFENIQKTQIQIIPKSNSMRSELKTILEKRDIANIPHMIIGDQSLNQTIQRFNMAIDLNFKSYVETDSNGISKTVNTGVQKNAFSQKFVDDSVNELHSVPFLKEARTAAYNKPVLNHIFKLMLKKGATISRTNSEKAMQIITKTYTDLTNWRNATGTGSMSETRYIEENRYSEKQGVDQIDFEISDRIFTDFEYLLDFVIAASKIVNFDNDNHILGIEDISDVFHTYAFSLASGNWNKNLYRQTLNDNLEFPWLDNSDLDKHSIFRILYSKLTEAIKSKGIYIYDKKSNWTEAVTHKFKNHNLAISIGNTGRVTDYWQDQGYVQAKEKYDGDFNVLLTRQQFLRPFAWEQTKANGMWFAKIYATFHGPSGDPVSAPVQIFSKEYIDFDLFGSNFQENHFRADLNVADLLKLVEKGPGLDKDYLPNTELSGNLDTNTSNRWSHFNRFNYAFIIKDLVREVTEPQIWNTLENVYGVDLKSPIVDPLNGGRVGNPSDPKENNLNRYLYQFKLFERNANNTGWDRNKNNVIIDGLQTTVQNDVLTESSLKYRIGDADTAQDIIIQSAPSTYSSVIPGTIDVQNISGDNFYGIHTNSYDNDLVKRFVNYLYSYNSGMSRIERIAKENGFIVPTKKTLNLDYIKYETGNEDSHIVNWNHLYSLSNNNNLTYFYSHLLDDIKGKKIYNLLAEAFIKSFENVKFGSEPLTEPQLKEYIEKGL